jgi:hypothetical protein
MEDIGRDRLTDWFAYLEEECLGQDGLLCFYDLPKSLKVSYFSDLLAQNLDSPLINADHFFFLL